MSTKTKRDNSLAMAMIAANFEDSKDKICLIHALEKADFWGQDQLRAEIIDALKTAYSIEGQKIRSLRKKEFYRLIFDQAISEGMSKADAYREIETVANRPGNKEAFGRVSFHAVEQEIKRQLKSGGPPPKGSHNKATQKFVRQLRRGATVQDN